MRRVLQLVLLSSAFVACAGSTPTSSEPPKPQTYFVVSAPPCAERDRLTGLAVDLAKKAEASPDDRSLDRPIVSAGLQSILHERQHHAKDTMGSRAGYLALKPALQRVVEKTDSCEMARDAGRVSAVDGDATVALAVYAGRGRACRTPSDDASVCVNASRPLSTEEKASARAQLRDAWPRADRKQRLQLLRAVQRCSPQADLARELEFAGAPVRDAFLAQVAREEAEDQRRITAQVESDFAPRDQQSRCESACLTVYGESVARTGPDATLCDNLCGGDTSCRQTCQSAGTSCFARCGGR
jgi:hypothetical protein